MGIIRMGLPTELITRLAKQFNVKNFIETGTYYGGTAIWASKKFEKVLTIEYSQEIYNNVSNQHKSIENIKFLFGDSREKLKKLINELDSSSIFWLDAHWSGGLTYGDNDQCPLIEEINIINCAKNEHFILIDDARLFTSPPQPPHKIEHWPHISEVISALKSKSNEKYIVIIEDVIIAVPNFAKPVVSAYCQRINAKNWEEYGKMQRKSNLQKGVDLIVADINLRIKSSFKKIRNKIFI
jgi:hypothetical protein